jgi:AcrR family transcriptional regulator
MSSHEVSEVRVLAVQAKFEIRKKKILDAPERIFAQKGFQEATVSDVARVETGSALDI